MTDKELTKILEEFTSGLLKKAKCKHAGNCMTMCQILKPCLSGLFDVSTLISSTQVKQGRKKVNHYYLMRTSDGIIIDATSSQFKFPDGKQMPKVYIGIKPDFYI